METVSFVLLMLVVSDVRSAGSTRTLQVREPELDRLVRAYFDRNPDWIGRDDRVQAIRSQQEVALAYPDPLLSYRWFAAPTETRVGPTRHAFGWRQPIPGRGKRRVESQRHELRASVETWESRSVAVAEVSQLQRYYLQAAGRTERSTLLKQEMELLSRFEEVALTRYATGEGTQVAVIKLQTDINRLADERSRLAMESRSFASEIAALLDGSPLTLDDAALPTRKPGRPPSLAPLLEMADNLHPAVRALQLDLRAHDLETDRTRLSGRPDYTVGVDYVVVGDRRDRIGRLTPPADNGDDGVSLNVGVRIPLDRSKTRSAVAGVEARRATRSHKLARLRNRLLSAVRDASTRIETYAERMTFYDEVLLPQARQALSASEAAYRSNRLGSIDLLDAQRVLFNIRRQRLTLLTDYWLAVVDLQEATGDLPAMGRSIAEDQR
ncbi:MAG: TolC family protein [Acidobacteriota bacterium]|nr:TolC family protein [Acidobacteriota bacterium]MDH3784442.1 TolC family protein [Acidobacteriota bacterium]